MMTPMVYCYSAYIMDSVIDYEAYASHVYFNYTVTQLLCVLLQCSKALTYTL